MIEIASPNIISINCRREYIASQWGLRSLVVG